MKRKKTFSLLIIAILLVGCNSTYKKVPATTLMLNISAGSDINAMGANLRAPLKIRLYELRSKDLFEQSDFLDLFSLGPSTLQDTLIRKYELPIIQPDEHRALPFQLDSDTKFIAILAEFANFKFADTKVVYAVNPGKNNPVTLFIEGHYLRLITTPGRK